MQKDSTLKKRGYSKNKTVFNKKIINASKKISKDKRSDKAAVKKIQTKTRAKKETKKIARKRSHVDVSEIIAEDQPTEKLMRRTSRESKPNRDYNFEYYLKKKKNH